jgi:hypothetical protein
MYPMLLTKDISHRSTKSSVLGASLRSRSRVNFDKFFWASRAVSDDLTSGLFVSIRHDLYYYLQGCNRRLISYESRYKLVNSWIQFLMLDPILMTNLFQSWSYIADVWSHVPLGDRSVDRQYPVWLRYQCCIRQLYLLIACQIGYWRLFSRWLEL